MFLCGLTDFSVLRSPLSSAIKVAYEHFNCCSEMADEDLFPKRRNRHLNKRENSKEKLRESERGEERMRV